MRKQLLAFVLLCPFALAACTPVNFEDKLRESLPKVCAAINIAHATFQTVVAAGQIPASIVAKENAAMAGVDQVCADPAAVTDVASAANALARAYVAVVQALNAARAI